MSVYECGGGRLSTCMCKIPTGKEPCFRPGEPKQSPDPGGEKQLESQVGQDGGTPGGGGQGQLQKARGCDFVDVFGGAHRITGAQEVFLEHFG